jgi:TolA-binding protein
MAISRTLVLLLTLAAAPATAAPATSKLSVTVTARYQPTQVLAVIARPELDAVAAGASDSMLGGPVRIEQEQILLELIKHTPTTEIEELSDYRFRLGELYAKQLVNQRRIDPNATQKINDLVAKLRNAFDPMVTNPAFKNYPKLDMVLFIYGMAIQPTSAQDARTLFQRLLKDYPNSKFVPESYLAFADDAFERAALADAESFYKQVLKYPKAKAYAYAQYKLGYLYLDSAKHQEALETFFQVAQTTRNESSRQLLFRAALRGFVRAYAEIGKPDKAFPAFERVDKASAAEMATELAIVYAEKGAPDRAIAIYQALLAQQPDNDNACTWRVNLAKAMIATTPKGTYSVTVCNADVGVFTAWGKQNGVDVK